MGVFLRHRDRREVPSADNDVIAVAPPLREVPNKLKTSLESLQQHLKVLEEHKQASEKTAAHIKYQAQHTERQIKEEFEKIHQFLRDEEAARIAALKEEEELKSHMMRRKIEEMSGEIASLSDQIRNTEKEMEAENIPFLLNVSSTLKQYVIIISVLPSLKSSPSLIRQTDDSYNAPVGFGEFIQINRVQRGKLK
ncbi:E3 ubiquitin-protein ligase TRIM35-like [Brachyhypopomus gauderio]|uniref:E3 ubiquitin-protein ligase TRIM35-like n=1 Tax=Brachyhypopomus gauderio TaxID=698409 RepID=UPI0040421D9A